MGGGWEARGAVGPSNAQRLGRHSTDSLPWGGRGRVCSALAGFIRVLDMVERWSWLTPHTLSALCPLCCRAPRPRVVWGRLHAPGADVQCVDPPCILRREEEESNTGAKIGLESR